MEEKANFELMGAAVGPRFAARKEKEGDETLEFIKSCYNSRPKSLKIIPLVFCALFLALFVFDALTSRNVFPSLIIPIAALVYYVVFCVGMPWNNERSVAKKKKRETGDIYLFYEDRLFYSEVGVDANIKYSRFCEVRESENTFQLFTEKTRAHIVRKDSIEGGDIDAFRAFIAEKTEHEVKSVSSKSKPGYLVKLLIALLVFAAVVVGCILFRGRLVEKKLGDYTVSVPAYLQDAGTDYGYDYELNSDKYFVNIYSETASEAAYYLDFEPTSAHEYAEAVSKMFINVIDPEITDIDENTSVIEFRFTNGDGKFYELEAFTMSSDGVIYVSEFYCHEELRDKFEEDFMKYAKTAKADNVQ